jgi:hypothetical protein
MLDFPSSPTTGQIFTAPNGSTWIYDGVKWASTSAGTGFLPLSGGTLSGNLTIAPAGDANLILNKSGSGHSNDIFSYTAGSPRWLFQFGNSTAEGSSNTGSDFVLARYDNSGNYLDAPLIVQRGDGRATVTQDPIVPLGIATKEYVDNTGGFNNVGRNLINNSMMRVAQRGNGPFTAAGYSLDQWVVYVNADTVSVARGAFGVGGPTGDEAAQYFLTSSFTGTSGAAAVNGIVQKIENVARLSGKTIIVSFWANTNTAPKLGVNVYQSFGSGGSPSTGAYVLATGQQFAIGSTWARYSCAIAIPSIVGKTLGTNGDDHTQFIFFYSSGATNNQIAGNIGVQSGTINIWGVQVEIAAPGQTQPSPLEKPDLATELVRCQRYFEKSYNQFIAPGAVNGGGRCQALLSQGVTPTAVVGLSQTIRYAATKRAVPTITLYSDATGASGKARDNQSNVDVTGTLVVNGDSSFGWSAVQSVASYNVNLTCHWTASAEL